MSSVDALYKALIFLVLLFEGKAWIMRISDESALGASERKICVRFATMNYAKLRVVLI